MDLSIKIGMLENVRSVLSRKYKTAMFQKLSYESLMWRGLFHAASKTQTGYSEDGSRISGLGSRNNLSTARLATKTPKLWIIIIIIIIYE